MIISSKTPGAKYITIVGEDGTDLTKKHHIESFDMDSGDAIVVEWRLNAAGQNKMHRGPMKFPNAKILVKK